jgi:hypothetical protein
VYSFIDVALLAVHVGTGVGPVTTVLQLVAVKVLLASAATTEHDAVGVGPVLVSVQLIVTQSLARLATCAVQLTTGLAT